MRIHLFLPGVTRGGLVWDLYHDLCEGVRAHGHEVEFVTMRRDGDAAVEDHTTLVSSSTAWRWLGRSAGPVLRTQALLSYAGALASHLRRRGADIDVLHVENVYPDGAAAVVGMRAAGWNGPLLVKPMGEDVLVVAHAAYGFRRYPIPRMLVSKVLRRAAGVRCASPLILETVREIGAAGPTRLIPVNVNQSATAAAEESKDARALRRRTARATLDAKLGTSGQRLIVSLARLHPFKGLDVLIEALAQIPDATLLIAGPSLQIRGYGNYADYLSDLAISVGARERVHFLGSLPPKRALELLAAADVAAVPSHLEAHNKVCVEAAAVGTPFVVTETTGVSAYVPADGVGIVVPPRNSTALSWALTEILQGHWQPDRTAAAGWAQGFGPRRIGAQLCDFYEELGDPKSDGRR